MTLVNEGSGTVLQAPRSIHTEKAPRGPPRVEPKRRNQVIRWPSWLPGFVLILAMTVVAAIQPQSDEVDHATGESAPTTAPATSVPPDFDTGETQTSTVPARPATAEQSATVAEAIAQFDNAGLELPEVQIEFYDGYDGCQGHAGLFVAASGNSEAAVDRITICHHHKLILLHELAHAWMHYNLADDNRAAFVEHWGLNSWSDPSDPYRDLGIERAANTIAFTLNQTESTDNQAILRYICSYELLTGSTLEIHAEVDC